jgi:tetratricopeptide (TPR) repeat protein
MKRLLVAVLLFAGCATGLRAQLGPTSSNAPKQFELSVRVTYENGRPVGPNVRVELLGAYGGSVALAMTDTSGTVRLTRLDPGRYKLRVTGTGFDSKETEAIDMTDGLPRYNETVQVKQSATPGEGVPTGTVDANVPADARKEFEKADENMHSQDWNGAQKHLEKAIAIYPKYAMAHNNLAVVYARLKQNDKAVESFRTAAQLDEHLHEANMYLGQFYYDNHDFKQAEPYLQHAATDDPKNAQLLLVLANCELRNGEPDQALANAQKVHALPDHKKFAAAHLIAGQVLSDKGDAKAASEEYRLFLKEDPTSPMAPKVKDALTQLETASK